MSKTSSIKKLFRKYVDKVHSLNKDKHIDDIYLSLLNGKNSYMRYHKYESSLFDSSWIEVVEDVLMDLGDIVTNPRQVTKEESNIVPVELAKKINGESVQHLASHTQYIKDIDEHGNVVPSKILSHSNEDYLFTYENRFIATFIRRLVTFVEMRYEYIKSMVPLHTEDYLFLKNKTEINGQEVEIETKIKVKKETDDNLAIKNNEYIERILKMREYIFYYYNSPFMRKMKNERDVRKPILQTNIIRKNQKYNKCFRTFMFIEKFDSLGVNYKVDETYSDFSKEEMADLNYLLLSQYLSLQSGEEFDEIRKISKTYKPKIKTSIDDESFIYGPPLTGTLEFVRVDDAYRQYLNSMGDIGLPLKPNIYEKLYYQGEYQLTKECKKEFDEIEKLLRRKIKNGENWEKYVEAVLARVAIEDREEERRRLEAIIKEELALIEKKRQELIAAAKAHKKDIREEEKELKAARKNKNKDKDKEPAPEVKEEKPEEPVVTPVVEENKEKENIPEVPPYEEKPVEEEVQTSESKPEEETPLPEVSSEAPVNNEVPQEEIKGEGSILPEAPVVGEEPASEAPVTTPEASEEQVSEPNEEETPSPEESVPEEKPAEVPPHKEERVIYARQIIVEDENGVRHVQIVTSGGNGGNSSSMMKDENTAQNTTKNEEPKPKVKKYIVKALNGYYVDEHVYSKNIEEAKVFDSFESANEVRKRLGGRVIKL